MKNRILAALLALSAVRAPVGTAGPDVLPEMILPGGFRRSGFDIPVTKVAVPMADTPHGPVILAEINGVSLRLGVDTGASRTVIFTGAAKRAGLKIIAPEPVRTASGQIEIAGLALAPAFRIGHARITNEPVMILPEPPAISGEIDGALGIATLRDWDVRLDVPGRTMTLFPSGASDALPAETVVRLSLSRQSREARSPATSSRPARVFVPIAVNGRIIPVLLDTGFGGPLSLPAPLAEALEPGVLARSAPLLKGSVPASGVIREREALFPQIVFGPDTYRSVPVIIEFHPPGSPLNVHGTIGMELLRRYVMTFGFAGERLALRRVGEGTTPD